jgi:hypothetical protein
MARPNGYRETYVLNVDTAYRIADMSEQSSPPGSGSLHRGRVVWLENDPHRELRGTGLNAYAEGIGMVLLNADCLDRARLLRIELE